VTFSDRLYTIVLVVFSSNVVFNQQYTKLITKLINGLSDDTAPRAQCKL